MIIGKLKNISRYKGISKNIDTAIDYILNNDLLALPKGKTIIDGDNVYVNRDTYVADQGVFFILEEGFALVYTEDIHLAKCDVNGGTVEKCVFKIKIED